MMKVAKAIAETNRPFFCTIGYLKRLALVHICILFPSISPNLQCSFNQSAPATPVAVTHAFGYACNVVVGHELYEKAYEIAAAHATS